MPGNGSVWIRWFRSERKKAASNAASTRAVETVGLYHVTYADPYDGSASSAWHPIVLFASGEAALGIAALADPIGEKRAHPATWTRWRRTREGYDYWSHDGWRAVSSTIAAAPPGLRLDGCYAHDTSAEQAKGSGVLATWNSVTFARSGRFTRERGAASFGPRFSATERTATAAGSYDITDYCLTLRHDDGRIEIHSLVLIHDKKVIWIDGIEYIRQR